MRVLYLILYIVAALCFIVAAFAVRVAADTDTATPRRVSPLAGINLVALGLLAWVLVPLIQTIDNLGD